jgi:periplasmic protein TonB
MALRCLLFSSDEGTAAPILQVLAGLDVEGEHCADAVATVDKVTHQSFQIVIIDWDQQAEARLLLTAARERKAAERPLTLAIVNDDASVPQALQAGANSILRKPLMANQIKDTLTTARDLLRAKQESAATVAQAAAAGASASSIVALPANADQGSDRTLRAGEFLTSGPTAPGRQFETDSDAHVSSDSSSAEPVDPLKDLEPTAASVTQSMPATMDPLPPPAPGETRGLEWYLKARGVGVAAAPAPAQPTSLPASGKPELLGFDQATSYSPATPDDSGNKSTTPERPAQISAQEQRHQQRQEQKKEAELFAYISGETGESEEAPRPRSRMKGAIIGALVLAACAVTVAPQAPWHPKILTAWAHGKQTLHVWLNPQPVTTPQAPAAHENFGRAGDEYKLPVTENIPDATTDPSQIQVLPVVDPTVKKPNSLGGNAEQPPADATSATPGDQMPPAAAQPATPDPGTAQPANGTNPAGTAPTSPAPSPAPAVAVPAPAVAPHSDPPASVPAASAQVTYAPVQAAPQNQQPHYATPPGNVPSSLKSQMASMTPDASGNKPAEAAMQSIEPVAVTEAAERLLITDQPPLDYPASARGQQGTVILQVLIGRDGAVQDAKFVQGSLAFARSAIDGVKLWKFKPYVMNGRPVSVQTTMTIILKP